MRLFLSSYGAGNHPEELVRLLDGNNRAAIISNAGDYRSDEESASKLADEIKVLKSIGIEGEELDLRAFFGAQQELTERLRSYGLAWVRGGNVFVLRRAMAASGFDAVIKDLLHEDALVYGGFSAGACAATHTLIGLELMDDPAILPAGYEPENIWDGLGLVNYSIVPHYQSDHPESDSATEVVKYLEQHAMPYKILRDGEAIVIDGDEERLVA